jgi:uncharacterized protein (TIGR02145 family)
MSKYLDLDGLTSYDGKLKEWIKSGVVDITDDEIRTLFAASAYQMVDLGLPSGIKWADRNVGASSPEDAGLYFQWGSIKSRKVDDNNNVIGDPFDMEHYDHYNPTTGSYIKYTEGTCVVESEDDAATVNMGEGWRTPTIDDWQELIQNTTQIFIDIHGNEYKKGIDSIKIRAGEFKGVRFESSTGSIFIPASGHCDGNVRNEFQQRSRIWSAIANGGSAKYMYFSNSGSMHTNYSESRYYGRTIRGVLA